MPDATVIDALVVTLGLDPSKFGSGAQAAQKKLVSFNQAVKNLGVDETKLTDKQRKRVQALREQEVQSARTTKEITASERASKQLFSTLEKGAAGIGAYLGVSALKSIALDAIHSGAAIERMSRTMGMGTTAADTWGKALKAAVNGAPESAFGVLQSISDELAGASFKGVASMQRLLSITSILSRYNGGAKIPLFDKNNQPLPADQVLLSMADSVHAMGPQKAHALLGGQLPDDMINFLLMGRKADEAALSKAAPDAITPKQADEDKKLEQQLNELGNAFDKLKTVILAIAAPELLSGLRVATAWLRYLRSDKTDKDVADRDMAIRGADAALHDSPDDPGGKKWLAQRDAEGAYETLTKGYTETPDGQQGWFQRAAGAVGVHWGTAIKAPVKHWPKAQAMARLMQLIQDGNTPDRAAAIVAAEEASGRAPGAQMPVAPLGGGFGPPTAIGGLLDAMKAVELGGNPNAVSSAGARGPYQLMPGTAAQYGVSDPTNEGQSRAAAGRYMSDLLRRYHGNLAQALGAYNWGPGNMDSDLAKHGGAWQSFLPTETAAYIPRVMSKMAAASGAQGGSTTSIAVNGPINVMTQATDAHGVAKGIKGALVAQADSGPH